MNIEGIEHLVESDEQTALDAVGDLLNYGVYLFHFVPVVGWYYWIHFRVAFV
jgi:hypothetical protein